MDTCWSLTVLAILILSIAGIFPVLCRFYNSAQVMQEKALSSGQIYTSSKNFTRPPIATDARTVSHPWKILGLRMLGKKRIWIWKEGRAFEWQLLADPLWIPTFSWKNISLHFLRSQTATVRFLTNQAEFKSGHDDEEEEDFCAIKNLDFRIQWGPQGRTKSEKFWGGFQCDRHSIPALLCQYH